MGGMENRVSPSRSSTIFVCTNLTFGDSNSDPTRVADTDIVESTLSRRVRLRDVARILIGAWIA